MIIRYLSGFIFVVLLAVFAAGCKSEFEKIRISNDPARILAAGYDYYEKEDYLRAQTLFELILSQYRGTSEAEKLFFHYAYTHYNLRQYLLASHYFKNFANTFAYSDYREDADYLAGYASYKLSPIFRLDQKATETAIEEFQNFVNKYPNSERVAECNRLIDELRAKLEAKVYDQGRLYYDLKQYQAAIHSFENLLKDYPDSDKAEEVRFRIVESAFLYAENSIYERKKERYEEASEKYRNFVTKFRSSKYKQEVREIYTNAQKQIKILENG
jgi:outer membrane protein assembly factor BamD